MHLENTKKLIELYSMTMKDKEIAAKLTELLGRPMSLGALRKLRARMGIVKTGFRGGCRVVRKVTPT